MWLDKLFYIHLREYYTAIETDLLKKIMTLEHAWNKILSGKGRIQNNMHSTLPIVSHTCRCNKSYIRIKYANILNNFL